MVFVYLRDLILFYILYFDLILFYCVFILQHFVTLFLREAAWTDAHRQTDS